MADDRATNFACPVVPGPCTSERRLGTSAVLKVFCERDFRCLLTSTANSTLFSLLSTTVARLCAVSITALAIALIYIVRCVHGDAMHACTCRSDALI